MIDALHPALEALPHGLVQRQGPRGQGANLTATMGQAQAGRATYIRCSAPLTGIF